MEWPQLTFDKPKRYYLYGEFEAELALGQYVDLATDVGLFNLQ
jgi:hypothetical protein